jgi:hypothetical protein
MKQLLIFFSYAIILTGSATSSINVVEHKDPSKPFSKVLAIYVDGDFEFRFFDSTTCNICIKSCFTDAADFEIRSKAENVLHDKFSSSQTTIVKSSDIFNTDVNSYDDFKKQIDSLGIDGILLISRRHYTHTSHALPRGAYSPNGHESFNANDPLSRGSSYQTPNAVFDCYLLKSESYFTLWQAQLDVKGKGHYNGKGALRSSMAARLAKNLTDGHYIFR